jgi:hypothetical protein
MAAQKAADVVAGAGDRTRLWPKLIESYADFDNYQGWTEREISVGILRPC